MRLPIERRLRPVQTIVLRALKAMFGDAPGPFLLASYNKPFFGNGWTPWDKSWAEFVKGSALPVPAALK